MDENSLAIIEIKGAIKRVILEELHAHIYPTNETNRKDVVQENFYSKFLLIAPCIEFLGACFDELPLVTARVEHDKIVERRFNDALKNLFHKKYLPFTKANSKYYLYKFYRCAILHQLRPGESIAFTTRRDAAIAKNINLQIKDNEVLILVIEDLYDDLRHAAEKLIQGYESGTITNKKGSYPFIKINIVDNLLTGMYALQNSNAWGIYHIGQFWFEIETGRTKAEYGIIDDNSFTKEIQQKIVEDHYPAIMHEFIHYLHDISTIQGIFYLTLDTTKKAIFSKYMSREMNSSKFLG